MMDLTASACDASEAMRWSVSSLVDAMHLGSTGLPVGGFAYSQGLEQAHEDGLISDRDSAAHWIRDALILVLARQDLPYWLACHAAARQRSWNELDDLVQELVALRETAELRMESAQMGYSIMQLFHQWWPAPDGRTADAFNASGGGALENPCELPDALQRKLACNYTAAHATLCAIRTMPATVGLTVYVWSWLEAQVMAALKIVPLGQRDGQWLLHQARQWIEQSVQIARETPLAQAGSAPFGLAILSARHETQYTRLFRS